uniref:uncharacterized protein LOC120337511 isoform X1 n=1 Tax=Styela clava TaxID=7725 RepID=UPI00193AD746|nr:uncharacterized protein LOC120337511 isoform X1 [Styela clava]
MEKLQKFINFFIIMSLATLNSCNQNDNDGNDKNGHGSMVQAKEVKIEWNVEISSIIIKLEAPTLGWVGIGFAPSKHTKSMKDADIIIGGVTNEGNPYVKDAHAIQNGVLYIDESQDVQLLEGREENGHTIVIFRRNITSNDSRDDRTIQVGEMGVIWAYGNEDLGDAIGSKDYHGENRGYTTISFIPDEVLDKRTDEAFQHQITLDKDDKVVLQWRIEQRDIVFEMTVETRGWVGLGFAPDKSMKNSDIILTWVDRNGSPHLFDCYGMSNILPHIDKHQNVEILKHEENDTHTTVQFKRSLISWDSDDRTIENADTFVIWAYGLHDMVEVPRSVNYHFNRQGHKKINFFQRQKDNDLIPKEFASMSLGQRGDVELRWASNKEYIYFEFTAPRSGWIGLGLSSESGKNIQDLFIAGVNGSGENYAFDMHVEPSTPPSLDEQQDIDVLEASEYGLKTKILMRRKLKTGDDYDAAITKGPLNVVWAFGYGDITTPNNIDFTRTERGIIAINLLKDTSKMNNDQETDPGHDQGEYSDHHHGPDNDHDHGPYPEHTQGPIHNNDHGHGPDNSHNHVQYPDHTHGPINNNDHGHGQDNDHNHGPYPDHTHGPINKNDHKHGPDNENNHGPYPDHTHGPINNNDHNHVPDNDHDHGPYPDYTHGPINNNDHRHGPDNGPHSDHTHEPINNNDHRHGPDTDYGHGSYPEHTHGPINNNDNGHGQDNDHNHGPYPDHTHGPINNNDHGHEQDNDHNHGPYPDHTHGPINNNDHKQGPDNENDHGPYPDHTHGPINSNDRSHGSDNDHNHSPYPDHTHETVNNNDHGHGPDNNHDHGSYPDHTHEPINNNDHRHEPDTDYGHGSYPDHTHELTNNDDHNHGSENDYDHGPYPYHRDTDSTHSQADGHQRNNIFFEELFLDENRTVFLSFVYDEKNIIFEMTAPTTGWMGLGISPGYNMVDADIIIMGVYDEGDMEPYLIDTNAINNGVPRVDEEQNVIAASSSQNGTHTTIEFSRPIVTTLPGDRGIENGLVNIIWAYGSTDVRDSLTASFYHFRNRGAVSVEFFLPNSKVPIDRDSIPINGHKVLDKSGKVILQWHSMLTPPTNPTMFFQLAAPTTGWIGFGFTPGHSMAGADISLSGIKDGIPYIYDMYGIKNGVPMLDKYRNIDLIDVVEDGQKTVVMLMRQMRTPDRYADLDIKTGQTNVIWAFGKRDINDSITGSDYHGSNRGHTGISFIPRNDAHNSNYHTHSNVHTQPHGHTHSSHDANAHTHSGNEEHTHPADGHDHARVGDHTHSVDDSRTHSHSDNVHLSDHTHSDGDDHTHTGDDVNSVHPSGAHTHSDNDGDIPRDEHSQSDVQSEQDNHIHSGDVNTHSDNGDHTHSDGDGHTHMDNDSGDDNHIPYDADHTHTNDENLINPSVENISIESEQTQSEHNTDDQKDEEKFTFELMSNRVILNKEKGVYLQWSYNEHRIVFQLTMPTKGWIGLGFSPGPSMAGADIIITGVRNDGIYALDTNADKNGQPKIDSSQDVDILKYSQNGTSTSVTFTRKLDTKDIEDNALNDTSISYLIWAFGRADIAILPRRFYHRKNRGWKMLRLIDGPGNLPIDYDTAPLNLVSAHLKTGKRSMKKL